MALKCTTERDLYEDVPFCVGQKSYPGLREHAYIIKRSNITAWPALPESPASLDAVAVLTGNFTLAADKAWTKIELVPKQQQFAAEPEGNWPTKLFKNTVTLMVPGTGKAATGLAAELNNDDVIMLIPQRDGQYRLVGNEQFKVDVSAALDSGKDTGDTNATTLTVTVEDEVPCPFYPGEIVTSEGTVSGADGKAVTSKG